MRKNTVTSKNRPPQNLTRFPNSRPKYTQTWHHVLKRPQPCINQIKYLHLTTAILLIKLGKNMRLPAAEAAHAKNSSIMTPEFEFPNSLIGREQFSCFPRA